MGGSGGTRTQSTPQPGAAIPDDLRPLIQSSVAGSIEAQKQLPLSDFTGVNIQEIPGLTPEEQDWMNKIFAWASDPSLTQGAEQGSYLTRQASETDPFEQIAGARLGELSQGNRTRGAVGSTNAEATRASVNTDTEQMRRAQEIAQQLTGGDVGSSPATLQAMKAWEDLVRPTVMAGQALTGNLGGGSTEEALAHGKTEALTPLLEQEINTRSTIAQMLGQLGLGVSGQEADVSKANAELGTRVSEGNAQRQLEAGIANQSAMLQAAGLDAQAAAQLAAIGAGRQGRKLQAGGQLAAIGTEKANLQISALAKALETAGMPREIAGQKAQAVYNDFLRRQGISESLTLGPTSNYLSGALTPGTVTESRQTGSGMFGS